MWIVGLTKKIICFCKKSPKDKMTFVFGFRGGTRSGCFGIHQTGTDGEGERWWRERDHEIDIKVRFKIR